MNCSAMRNNVHIFVAFLTLDVEDFFSRKFRQIEKKSRSGFGNSSFYERTFIGQRIDKSSQTIDFDIVMMSQSLLSNAQG